MGGYNYKYHGHLDNPELIAICSNCTEADCDGLCEQYKRLYRQLYPAPPNAPGTCGRQPNRIRPRPKRERLHYYNVESYTYNGETHTIKQWSEITGIKYNTLYMRLTRGKMKFEDAITMPMRVVITPEVLEVNGERLTVRQWSERTGLTMKCIYERLRSGYSYEDAVLTPKKEIRK